MPEFERKIVLALQLEEIDHVFAATSAFELVGILEKARAAQELVFPSMHDTADSLIFALFEIGELTGDRELAK